VRVKPRSRDRDHTVAIKTALNPLSHAADYKFYNYKVIFSCKMTNLGLGTKLFVKVLDQETAKGPFRSATCYYQSNHSKVEAIPLSALPKDTTSILAGLSPH